MKKWKIDSKGWELAERANRVEMRYTVYTYLNISRMKMTEFTYLSRNFSFAREQQRQV